MRILIANNVELRVGKSPLGVGVGVGVGVLFSFFLHAANAIINKNKAIAGLIKFFVLIIFKSIEILKQCKYIKLLNKF